ncbi:SCO7613 C-terminal domain-containing membrane protein [Streptomyces griseus]|uniref:SCO7613 C-terminal domain-containing membrane protein n=1 Tax=Streptomyces griseus TaxID=1911 RepID=UPI00068BF92D|nr:hypothetical protein [Streptomyces griseus]
MTHIPPPAEELRLLDTELWQLDARRAQLLARRAWLIAHLQPPRPLPPPQPAPNGPVPETTAPRVQNVLLLLGGVLLTIAAIAFTLVSWGHMGIAGRALVLGTVTAVTLAAPVPLLRRGLRSTAESVAGLGVALTVLDAYALHEVALTGADGVSYAAFASAVLALLWAGYGLGLGAVTAARPAAEPTAPARPAGLRLPLPFASVAAQLPLPLWAIAASAGTYGVAAALVVTAGFDTAVALLRPTTTAKSVRVTATVGAYAVGGAGVSAAGWLAWTAAGPGAAAGAAALLILAAAIALVAAWRLAGPALATGHAVAGGVLLVAASGSVLSAALPAGWAVPAHLACGIALLAAIRAPLPEPVRRGLAWASGSVQALALLWTVPLVSVALLGPVGWAERPWSGVPSDARAAVTVHTPWPPYPLQALLVLVAVAGVLALVVRDATWRPRALTGALVLAWATAAALPSALGLPYLAALLVLGALTAATVFTSRSPATILLALVGALNLAFLSLASQTADLVVLSALTVLFAAASWRPRTAPFTAPAALGYATALACATGAAADWQPQYTALLALVVPGVAALLAARLGGAPATVPVEAAGLAAGLLAVALAVTDGPVLALVLALCAVITAGTAVRAERRPVGYVAAALFLLATWVRLASWDVTTPEAYTLPVSVPALLVGALRRRRDPAASSWTAYGPGLAATLVPSLMAAWTDPHGTRPLLLGVGALLVTLLGARHRLRAPLVVGGSVLVLDAVHELAPYLVQVADALPRWVPPALAGLLLLALGATYEQRLRNVRQVRDVLGRMN